MSLYRNVHVSMWGDAKFRSLSDDAKILWLYLLTGPETTSAPGCIVIGRASLAEALDWEVERLDAAFAEVASKGMAVADWKARLVWLPNAIRYIVPASWQHVKGWIPYIQILPECALKDKAVGTIWSYVLTRSKEAQGILSEAFGDAYLERCLSSLDTPSDTPLHTLSDAYQARASDPHPIKDQDQDQDQDQERAPRARAREPRAAPPEPVAEIRAAAREARAKAKASKTPSEGGTRVLVRMAELAGCRYEYSGALEARLREGVPVEDCIAVVEHLARDPWWLEKRFANADAPFRRDKFPDYLAQAKAAPPAAPAQKFPGREPIPEEYARLR